MIVIDNVGSPEAEPPHRTRWLCLLLLLVLIYGSHAPLISLTKVDGRVPFSPSSCVLMIEFTKLVVSFAALLASENPSGLKISALMVAPYAIPALLYAFNNNLVVFMQAYMDPSSFQVLSNLKIASTALLYTSCLGKRLRVGQWLAVGMLMAAGVCHSYSGLDWEASEGSAVRLHVTSWGLLLVLIYCFISGLAAVYTERVLKTQRLPLSLQNLFLYVFGVGINLAANGLLMSVIMKHGTGITRLFVISSSMLVNGVLSWGILGIQLTPYFLFPVVLIGWAVYLYYR
ncbi:putative UDP-sugar transporter protein SLC35A4 [Labeo rohita]|uniref:UDP-sugar transporter protein SLC35A4 n=1 Tax=Labeo rohita TaxID=84645 RepID=A0ABQ8M3M5_LABRO|nr:putative UDP-sugar transporter protein SLC35A4 [Labeo rohita]